MLSVDFETRQTLFDLEERLNLYKAGDESDKKLSLLWMSFNFNFCKFIEGSAKNIFTRIVADNFFNSLSSNYSCPIIKGTKRSLKDLMITDNLLPPFPQEMKMRLEYQSFAKIKNEKKFRIMHKENYYVSVKK
jgi:Protein of unknown function (DUF1091)